MINEVIIYVDNDLLSAEIIHEPVDDCEYYFYLLRDGSVVDRKGWYKNNKNSWENLEPGDYQVRGFIKVGNIKESLFSGPAHILDGSLDLYIESLENEVISLKNNLYISHSEPHQDLLLVNINLSCEELEGYVCETINIENDRNTYIYSKEKVGFQNILFSGSAFRHDELIFSQTDAEKQDVSIFEKDLIGDYSVIFKSGDSIVFSNDYFGNGKIFYYKTSDCFFASNNFHLLLLSLSKYKIFSQKYNKKVLLAFIASGSTQPFQQIFTHEMFIENLYMMRIDQKIKVSPSGISFMNKDIFGALNVECKNSDFDYQELIKQGAQDIINNSKAVLSHEKFKYVVADATGGMDSRVTLATLNQFKNSREKIFIASWETTGLPMDIKIGCSLAAVMGLHHDNIREKRYKTTKNQNQQEFVSRSLGCYWAVDIQRIKDTMSLKEETANITGAYGEICLRPYYSRSYLDEGKFINENSTLEFSRSIGNRTQLNYPEAVNSFHQVFSECLDELPGESILEKYDLHYLFLEMGYTFQILYV